MTSTLNCKMNDTMDEEVDFNDQIYDQHTQHSQQQQQQQQQQQPSQNDYLQFLSLPNQSQDSIQKLLDFDQQDEENFPCTNNTLNSTTNPAASQTGAIQSNTLDGIYSAYGDPDAYANPELPEFLFNTNFGVPMKNSNNSDDIYDHNNNSSLNPHDLPLPLDINNNDDILMIPQDNYYMYDQQDPQFIPELMQLELSNKSFPQSNELNIFKSNDVFYEFSDDDDDEDDIDNDLQNKLDNDDMDMNLDPYASDENSDESSDITMSNNNYNMSSYLFDDNITNDPNSIYSLTVPNQFNSSTLNNLYDSAFPSTANSFPSASYNQFNSYNTSNTKYNDENEEFVMDDEDEDEEDNGIEFEDEDEIEGDDDLYTPAFKQRKESVTADSKPSNFKKSSRSVITKQNKRIGSNSRRRSSNLLTPVPSSLRKPRTNSSSITLNPLNNISNVANNNVTKINFDSSTSSRETSTNAPAKSATVKSSFKSSPTSSGDAEDEEEHVCNIPNPKTGKLCLKKFSRPYDLVRHQNTIHASKRSFYRCMFCEDDLRRKNNLETNNDIVKSCKYRDSQFSIDNSQSHITNSHNVKKNKLTSSPDISAGYLSNKTFSRCDALTRHLRFRHGLNNSQVVEAMDFAKKNVEYYDN